MKPAELLELLREFYREKLALMLCHQASAERIGHYAFNNAYQYVIAREETHLQWLRAAIEGLGGSAGDLDQVLPPEPPEGRRRPEAAARPSDGYEAIIREDARDAQAFVERWRDRVERISNARHQGMLRLTLGETLEHKRFFDQALAGRADLLGRHADGAGTRGQVLPTRWVE